MSKSFLDCGCCIVDGHRTFCPTCLAGPIPTEKSSKDQLIEYLKTKLNHEKERWELENATLKQVVEERNQLRKEALKWKNCAKRLYDSLNCPGLSQEQKEFQYKAMNEYEELSR